MKKRRNWSWREGKVDRTNDYFDLRYGSANDSGWNESQAQVVGPLIDELDFFLVEKGEANPWAYAQYHADTLSNVYSSIHWSFFPKRPPEGQMKGEPRSPGRLDPGATFGGSK